MDYKEKYEQALERARQFSEKPYLEDSAGIVEYIFPELKESEEEKTKRILHSISRKMSFHLRDIFTEEEFQCFDTWSNAWLEKQGEENIVVVIPKFRVGDVIRPKGSAAEYTIESISGECYHGKGWGLHISCDDDYELVEQKPVEWSKEDKLKMDTLVHIITKQKGSAIFEGFLPEELIGWLWSFKDRVQPQQKPAEWSKEDEEISSAIVKRLEGSCALSVDLQSAICWVENVKGRVQPQPRQEWSEEDRKLIDETCNLINTLANGYGEKVTEPISFAGVQQIYRIKTRLRALVDSRLQSHWKPSEEKLNALWTASNKYLMAENGNVEKMVGKVLESLYNDLKKLKG